jgi:hypothetical protein
MQRILFQGEYYMASTNSQQEEVIQRFLEGDYKTLVIIDESLAIENIKDMRGDSECSVEFLSELSKSGVKGIYINNTFDLLTQNFIKENWSLLAFFSSG